MTCRFEKHVICHSYVELPEANRLNFVTSEQFSSVAMREFEGTECHVFVV
jgi:hypothetical protein